MFERILVPLDGSATAEAVLPHVVRLARRSGAEVTLVRAVVPMPVDTALPISIAMTDSAEKYLEEKARQLELKGIRTRILVEKGPPAWVILEAARRDATLIAMATHGTTGLARLVFGSVAESLLRASPVPVYLVRPAWTYEVEETPLEERPVKKVLIPLDRSERSAAILPHALALVKLMDARAVVLHAIDPKIPEFIRMESGEEFSFRGNAVLDLQDAARTFQSEGYGAVVRVEEGGPVETILETCKRDSIDLIVMSTHGRSGISRLVLGSVTEQVLRRAEVPVIAFRSVEAPRCAVTGRR